MFTDNQKQKIIEFIGCAIDVDQAIHKLAWFSAILDNDDLQTQTAMICVYHEFRDSPEPAIAAAQWRITRDIFTAAGNSVQSYYDAGYKLFEE